MVSENETWILTRADEVIGKEASSGTAGLSDWEKLVLCLWAADYGVRNGESMTTAEEVHPGLMKEGLLLANRLELRLAVSAYSLEPEVFVDEYYDRFEDLCSELRIAEPPK